MKRKYQQLPKLYELFLDYWAYIKQPRSSHIANIRRVLFAFHNYLENSQCSVSNLTIEQIDGFLLKYSHLAPPTQRLYRLYLRHFFKYIYREFGILDKDLSLLLETSHSPSQVIPPKFLRPHELKKLFNMVDFSSPKDLRVNAMLHLAFTLGLLPREICMVTLDDIHFQQCEIILPYRRNISHFKIPLSEDTVKAIAIYIIHARPKSNNRALFLKRVCRPVSSKDVSNEIYRIMRKANLTSSAFWLRHTYAKTLMESGASVYEIKEMLGLETIQTAKRYLQIDTKLMREVLFNETL
jgi:integrase/recombinase XerD